MNSIGILNNLMFKNSLNSLKCSKIKSGLLYYQICYFCNEKILGLDEYLKVREKFTIQYNGYEKIFLDKMSKYANVASKDLIFTEDMKHVLHLAGNDEIELVKNMLIKFSKQNERMRFGNFLFGPVIMRFLSFLNKPRDALDLYNNKLLNSLFDNISSHLVLMDLLFKNDMNKEIIDVYNCLRDKQLLCGKYPKNIMLYVFAACYKLNTPEYYEYIKNIYNGMEDSGANPYKRILIILGALALKHNDPQFALNVIADKGNWIGFKNVRVCAYAALDKAEDAINLLNSVLLVDSPKKMKQQFYRDVVNSAREAVLRSKSDNLLTKFNRIEKQLETHDHINNECFENYFFSEVPQENEILNDVIKASFSETEHRKNSRISRRLGLTDMI